MDNISLFCSIDQMVMDNDTRNFDDFNDFVDFIDAQTSNDIWERHDINGMEVDAISDTDCYDSFCTYSSEFAMKDTLRNSGIALSFGGYYLPLGDSAIGSLEDRCKIAGNALTKVSKPVLADILNNCAAVQKGEALMLIRGGKCRAVHSGSDYCVLPMDQLLSQVVDMLDNRFPGAEFSGAYVDHIRTCASWNLPNQTEELLGKYKKHLEEEGRTVVSSGVPVIRFESSDTGFASAKLDAMIGTVMIGSCCAVDHRGGKNVSDFADACKDVFVQFEDCVNRLEALLDIELDYPVNAMTRICKRLGLPKKQAVEACANFKDIQGDDPGTAHDVFCALQEVLFLMDCEGVSQKKVMNVQENLSRALNLRWKDYDLPLPVDL